MRRTFYSGISLLFAVVAIFLFGAEPSHAQQRQTLQTRATAPVGAKLIGRMPASQQMSLALTLSLRNREQLNALLQQLEDPTSPNYHHYLSVADFTERFGPTASDYQRVIDFARSQGLKVTYQAPNRKLLDVVGSVANVERAFQITMQVYQHPTENRTFYASNVEPTVTAGVPLQNVVGLTNIALPHPADLHPFPLHSAHPDSTGSGPDTLFLGSDIRAAYYGSGPLVGAGQALALAEFGPWNIADVQNYFSTVGQPLNVPIVTELMNGVDGVCVPPTSSCDDGEEVIDIQQQISMAPGASVLIVYESYGTSHDDLDVYNRYVSDNLAKEMSFSFGIPDDTATKNDSEEVFLEMHAQGQNLFVASGDAGASVGGNGWPGYSSNVTDVGGTDLTTDGAGGAWVSETGWGGSTGGWCDTTIGGSPCNGADDQYDVIPSYQSPVIGSSNGGTTTYRNLPDVAAEANTDNFFCGNGSCGGVGGTSLAAPRFGAFVALANEQAAANGETIGLLNPTVYTIGQGSNYATVFHDITSGNDANGIPCTIGTLGCLSSGPQAGQQGFNAVTGFDLVTGWGTPNGQGMIDALAPVSTANAFFTLSASPSTLNLTPGGTAGTTIISLTPGNGFTGSVTLAANVIASPAGVTASFNPTSISGSGTSTLTVSTTSGTPAGTLMIAVTGTSSGGIETQPAFVTLALPDFLLSVTPATAFTDQPSSIYMNQGSSATATVTVNPQNNFTGTVNLSVSGLPKGVTGSFSPTSTKTTSSMTLTATSNATTGTDYLTVSGASGNISPLNAPYSIVSVSAATGTGGSGTPVDLSADYNLPAIYADGITFGTGMDGQGSGYSSNLLTANRILSGVQFNFGPASTKNCTTNCTNDAVSVAGQTITLPAGQQTSYTTFQILAAATNGPITGQTITVNYTDGSSSTFTQNFSDWCSCSGSKPGPGQQSGESFAVVMPYRDGANGTEDNTAFNLYAYDFVLNSAKTVKSFTLPAKPASGSVVVFAATFTTQNIGTQLNLSSLYNTAGLYNNNVTFPATGGMDGGGNNCTIGSGCADAYSAQQLGLASTSSPTLTSNGIVFDLGPVNTTDCTTACITDMVSLKPGGTITLPSNQQTKYTTLTMLGTGVQGSHTGTVTVNYMTGSAGVFNQTFSDWCNYQNASGNETIVVGGLSRINSDGTLNTGTPCNLYSYTFTLDSTRTVQSIALANTDSTNFSLVLALTLSGNTTSSGPSSFAVTAGTPNPATISPGGSSQASVTVTPANGFTGNVTLSCSIAPAVTGSNAPTCSFGSTSPVSITSGTPVNATLTFTTVGSSATKLNLHTTFYALFLPIPGLMLIGLGLSRRGFVSRASRKRRLLSLLALWILIAGLIVVPACGGGNGNKSGGGGGGNNGTPAGAYTITINASGGTQTGNAPTVQVTVN